LPLRHCTLNRALCDAPITIYFLRFFLDEKNKCVLFLVVRKTVKNKKFLIFDGFFFTIKNKKSFFLMASFWLRDPCPAPGRGPA
jgi:hypothetical protein